MILWRQPFDAAEKATEPGHIYIDEDKCKGCGFCVDFCPRKVLQISAELSPKGYHLVTVDNDSKCLACGFCEVICPEFAIKLSKTNSRLN